MRIFAIAILALYHLTPVKAQNHLPWEAVSPSQLRQSQRDSSATQTTALPSPGCPDDESIKALLLEKGFTMSDIDSAGIDIPANLLLNSVERQEYMRSCPGARTVDNGWYARRYASDQRSGSGSVLRRQWLAPYAI